MPAVVTIPTARSRSARASIALACITSALMLSSSAVSNRSQRADVNIALVGGTLIDGRGGQPMRNSVVLIRDSRIEAVGTMETTRIPDGYDRVSTEGMSVLPGLWDMHTHLQYSAHTDLTAWNKHYLARMETAIMPAIAEQLLIAGVTSARDMMAPLDPILRVRERIAKGEIPGPTMYVAGALLEHSPPAGFESFRWGVSGTGDARAKVDRLADKGVNVIKLLCVEQMTADEARAVVEQAHARGLMVAAHGRDDGEIRRCLAAGVDDFQHLGPRGLLPADIIDGLRARARERKMYWTPTVGNPVNNIYLEDDLEMLDDAAWQRALPPEIVADVRTSLAQMPAVLGRVAMARENLPTYRKKFDQLRDAGVELLVGTDSGNPGHFHPYAMWLELDAWVTHFGIPPMEAIRRATSFPAAVMGVERDYGAIEAGKYADIIAVSGDPLRHITVLRDPTIVIKHGRRVK